MTEEIPSKITQLDHTTYRHDLIWLNQVRTKIPFFSHKPENLREFFFVELSDGEAGGFVGRMLSVQMQRIAFKKVDG